MPPPPEKPPKLPPASFAAESWELSESFSLRLVRNSMVERECRLDIAVRVDLSPVALNCEYGTGREVPVLAVRDVLTASERGRVTALANKADLFGGGHIGRDGRDNDGALERLEVFGRQNAFAVLVVSGNPAFETEGPRRDLLTTVRAIERRLRALRDTSRRP